MNDDTRVAGIFREITETMLRYFHGWEKDLPHQGEKGGIRERRVADFLSMYLPRRYAIGTGHIIDSKGNISNQTDIIIYDALNGISLPVDRYYSLFPCECVYATIEVKSKLTASDSSTTEYRGEIYKCVESTSQIKRLHRGEGLHPIISAVFAYETAWKKDQWQRTAKAFYYFGKKYKMEIPELLLVINDPAFALCWYRSLRESEKDRFSYLYKKNPLMFFLAELIGRLSMINTATPNLWQVYGDWIPTDAIATIIPAEWYPEIS